MSDIIHALPDFDVKPYSHLLHSLEKNDITVADLLTLDPLEIARRCPLPLLEVRRLVKNVIEACQKDAGIVSKPTGTSGDVLASRSKKRKWHEADQQPHVIATLDADLDTVLDGGIHTGYITEISGESATGKTQFVLGLLLAAQLPAPYGLARSAIYISTEAPLKTSRLNQILTSHPFYAALAPAARPTLDHIHTISVNDLEAQDHILEFQVPRAVCEYNVGLIVIDSVAANYRAEHSTTSAAGMGERATDLAKLGSLLRHLATEHNVAVVVTNQVSDRFDDHPTDHVGPPQASSSLPGGTRLTQATARLHIDSIMTLDHQARFFTGWGGEQNPHPTQGHNGTGREDLKTPALGLAWANQIAARIVLKMEADTRIITTSQSAAEPAAAAAGFGGNLYRDRRKRRFMHVVFCPWAASSDEGVEYEIATQGIRSVKDETKDLLDARLWGLDGADDGEDEEYPF